MNGQLFLFLCISLNVVKYRYSSLRVLQSRTFSSKKIRNSTSKYSFILPHEFAIKDFPQDGYLSYKIETRFLETI